MWSFVGLKRNKQRIWLELDSDAREIVGMHVGSRDRSGAEAFSPVYRQCAVCYTDFWSAYERFFPKTDIEQLVKKAEKRTALKGSTLH